MRDTTNYLEAAESDARHMALNFVGEITEQLIGTGSASRDLFPDYPGGDSYHHEYHVDRDYNLQDAAELLDQLSDHEETDYGLWDGLEPRRAIAVQAAYTYGNAVLYYWDRIIEAVNERNDPLTDALTDLEEGSTEVTSKDIEAMVRQIIEES